MSLISVDTLHAAKLRYAGSDLRAAKREGYILIGQTKRGTLSLTHADGIYTLTETRLSGVAVAAMPHAKAGVLARGKASVVRPILADLYTVEFR